MRTYPDPTQRLLDHMHPRATITRRSSRGSGDSSPTSPAQRVVLTDQGYPLVVVDLSERLDNDVDLLRMAGQYVVDKAENLSLDRSPPRSLEDVCSEVGISTEVMHQRAAQLVSKRRHLGALASQPSNSIRTPTPHSH